METINTGWLFDENGAKFAPKTLASQVIDEYGVPLSEQNSNFINFCTCYSSATISRKTASCSTVKYAVGELIIVKFVYGNTAEEISLTLSYNVEHPIIYKNSSNYIRLKENTSYIFRYNGDSWELLGDLNISNTYTLSSFGVTASSKELNYCTGLTSNIQTQINNLKSNFVVKTFTVEDISIKSFSSFKDKINVALAGYTPISIKSWKIENATVSGVGAIQCNCYGVSINNNDTCVIRITNLHTTTTAKVRLEFDVLYSKVEPNIL